MRPAVFGLRHMHMCERYVSGATMSISQSQSQSQIVCPGIHSLAANFFLARNRTLRLLQNFVIVIVSSRTRAQEHGLRVPP